MQGNTDLWDPISTEDDILNLRCSTPFITNVGDGTLRTRALDQTLRLLWADLDTIGVSRVADVTDQDKIGLPVFNAYRPRAFPGNLTVSTGKGRDRKAALVSCLGEAYERHWAEPSSHYANSVSPSAVLGFGEDRSEEYSFVTRHAPSVRSYKGWMQALDLHDRLPVILPCDYFLCPFRSNVANGASDGVAAGNSDIEATIHGLLELIERDACSFGTWFHDGSRVSPRSYSNFVKYWDDVLSSKNIELSLFKFPTFGRVHVCYALLIDRETLNPMLQCCGAGAHVSFDVSSSRALTEALQTRVSVISGAREDLVPKYRAVRHTGIYSGIEGLERWQSKFPDSLADIDPDCSYTYDNPHGLLDALLEDLKRHGIRIYARRLNPIGSPLSVVSVSSPDLEAVSDNSSAIGPRIRTRLLRSRYSRIMQVAHE